ncbi:MAG: VOC family protein [Anaerolineae bacterium]|nr:VOC family protein [Anaerolineae bacterium]
MADPLARFPNLFRETSLGLTGMTAQFRQMDAPPNPALISNVNCVPFVGAQCVIITLEDGHVDIPGGTLEPGETYEAALHRELMEETGARVLDYAPLGAWFITSSLAEPYRPHLPHPASCRFVVYGDVELVRNPTLPPGGERVQRVDVVPVSIAAVRFRANGRRDLAELYTLAAEQRVQHKNRVRVERLDHLVLTVRDIEAAVDFYTRVLGMQAVTFGAGRRALRFGSQKINLHQAGAEFEPKAARPTPGSADLCFITLMTLDAVIQQVQACGVPIEVMPSQRTGALGTIESIYLRDPDDNLIEISTYKGDNP